MISDKRAQLTTTLLKEKKKDLLKLAIDSEIKVSKLIEIMTSHYNDMSSEERNKIIEKYKKSKEQLTLFYL